jgi:threonine dehydrogenase-like Zn-dependent dehydrogenase
MGSGDDHLMEKGLQAGSGQVHVQRYWSDLLSVIERGEFDPTFVLSHRWPWWPTSSSSPS